MDEMMRWSEPIATWSADVHGHAAQYNVIETDRRRSCFIPRSKHSRAESLLLKIEQGKKKKKKKKTQ